MLRTINIGIYIFLGLILTAIASIAFFLAPDYNPVDSIEVTHIIREAGSAGILAGLVCFWCALNYQKSKSLHLLLLIFFAFFSALHWMDFIDGYRSIESPLINSLPIVLLSFMYLDKKR